MSYFRLPPTDYEWSHLRDLFMSHDIIRRCGLLDPGDVVVCQSRHPVYGLPYTPLLVSICQLTIWTGNNICLVMQENAFILLYEYIWTFVINIFQWKCMQPKQQDRTNLFMYWFSMAPCGLAWHSVNENTPMTSNNLWTWVTSQIIGQAKGSQSSCMLTC